MLVRFLPEQVSEREYTALHRPQPQEIYRHFKGNLYQIITIAKHSETRQDLVVYQALYGDYAVYCRPLEMFTSEVDHIKYPDVVQKDRFELVNREKARTENTNVEEQDKTGQKSDPVQNKEKTAISYSGNIMDKTVEQEAEDLHMNPLVVKYLDADSAAERINIMDQLRSIITDDMIDIMAMAVDVEVNPGEIDARFDELKECLATMEKFETNRLRSL